MSFTEKHSFTTEQYNCPKTDRIETVRIEHTVNHVFTIHNLRECTGLDTCGVKKFYSSGVVSSESSDWTLCPLNMTLKTGR